jgi:hypothetical protein
MTADSIEPALPPLPVPTPLQNELFRLALDHFGAAFLDRPYQRKPPLGLRLTVAIAKYNYRLVVLPRWEWKTDERRYRVSSTAVRVELLALDEVGLSLGGGPFDYLPGRRLALLWDDGQWRRHTGKRAAWIQPLDEQKQAETMALLGQAIDAFLADPRAAFRPINGSRCCECRRRLTDGQSLARGIGPECLRRSEAFIRRLELPTRQAAQTKQLVGPPKPFGLP